MLKCTTYMLSWLLGLKVRINGRYTPYMFAQNGAESILWSYLPTTHFTLDNIGTIIRMAIVRMLISTFNINNFMVINNKMPSIRYIHRILYGVCINSWFS